MLLGALPAFLLLEAATGAPGQLRGQVVDGKRAPVQAEVQIVDRATAFEIGRFTTIADGRFEVTQIPAGRYVITVRATGFLKRERQLVIKEGDTLDLGEFPLNGICCDGPGIQCDDFSIKPVKAPASVSATLGIMETLDLDGRGGRADIRLTKQDGALSLEAINGAAMAAPIEVDGHCRDVAYANRTVAINNLGKGAGLCIRTNKGSYAHLFLATHIDEASTEVGLWYTTLPKR